MALQLSAPVRPEDDTIALQLRDSSGTVITEITNFREYTFNSHFLTPTDHFSFTIGDEGTTPSILNGITVGQKVTLSVSGYVQAGGYIDRIRVKTSRKSGTEVQVEGRDWLAPTVDANMDPQNVKFKPGQTLQDIMIACFRPYGYGIGQILTSDEANANIITGQVVGVPTTKKGKPLASFQLHQLKPYPHEGVFAFASRLSQRFGLWIWASADGGQVIVDVPDFDQKSIYSIFHKYGTDTVNYEDGDIDTNGENQPTVIVATGWGGGGEFPRSGMKIIMVNELTGLDANGNLRADVQGVLSANPDAKVLPLRSLTRSQMPNATFRPVYLHDDESKTIDQLEKFTRREMALRQVHGLTVRYTFEGHTLRGVPFYTNAMADIDDDVLRIHERMWCISRTMTKSRTGGTLTHTEWIVPRTLEFGS